MLRGTSDRPCVFAVVLAAGASLRFGSSKQLARYGGMTLVHRAARLARDVCGDNSVLVVGHRAAEIAAASRGHCRFMLVNERHEDGLGTSIALAARALEHTADALLVLLADQPLIEPAHLHAVLDAWSGTADQIVVSRFDDTRCPPALLPRASFAELTSLSGDVGAKQLFADAAFRIEEVVCSAAAVDIDSPADLERLDQPAD